MFRTISRNLIVALAVVVLAVAAALVRPGAAGAQTQTTKVNWNDPVQAINAFIPSINSYWNAVFVNYNRTYRAPGHIYWYGYTSQSTGQRVVAYCGSSQIDYWNAEFCPTDNNIYLGYDFMADQLSKVNAYGMIAILAHEWGHQISDQLGWLAWADNRGYYKGTELQADCFAGMYTRWAYDHTWLNSGNVSNAQMAFYGLGNDTDIDPYVPGSHGTKAERLQWFNVGFSTQNLNQCNNVYHAVYGA